MTKTRADLPPKGAFGNSREVGGSGPLFRLPNWFPFSVKCACSDPEIRPVGRRRPVNSCMESPQLRLTGGAGADGFVFGEQAESAEDKITDFSSQQGDKIDLTALDPNPAEFAKLLAQADTARQNS